jgi:hypothetical protein
MSYNRENIVMAVQKAISENPQLENTIYQILSSVGVKEISDIYQINESQLSMLIFKLVQAEQQVFSKLMAQAMGRSRSRSKSRPRSRSRSRSKSRKPSRQNNKKTQDQRRQKMKPVLEQLSKKQYKLRQITPPVIKSNKNSKDKLLTHLSQQLDKMSVRTGRFDNIIRDEPDWSKSPKKASKSPKKASKSPKKASKSPYVYKSILGKRKRSPSPDITKKYRLSPSPDTLLRSALSKRKRSLYRD